MVSQKCFLMVLVGMAVFASGAIAETVYVDDDLESGLNTTDPNAANYWRVRWDTTTAWGLTETQSHSATHSVLSNPTNSNEFFSGKPGMDPNSLWTGARTFYEVWVRLDNADADNEEVAIWQNPNPLAYSPIVRVRRNPAGNFHYQASTEAGLDAWVDTGVAYNTGVWYHLGWEMNPPTSTFDLYISTGAFTTPAASGSYSSIVGAWVGTMYFSSWSSSPEYYIDDVNIVGDLTPTPVCGDVDHPYPVGDFDQDCYVDFVDLAVITLNWLDCTDPFGWCNYTPGP